MENSTTQQSRLFGVPLSKKARGIIIGIITVLVLVLLGFLTYVSTPGNVLYSAKVYVAENLFSVTKVTQQQQFDYGVTLLESRLEELKTLAVRGDLTQKQLETFDIQFETQVQKIDQLLNSEDSNLTAREVFDTTNHMVSIVSAAEAIMDNMPTGTSERFDEVYRTAKAIHKTQTEHIVAQSTPEEMIEIIQEKLVLITQKLETQNQNTRQLTRHYLIDASEALSVQDFGVALQAVGSAIQLLEVRSQVNQTQG